MVVLVGRGLGDEPKWIKTMDKPVRSVPSCHPREVYPLLACTDCSMRRKTRMYESCATKDEQEASFQEKHPTDDPPAR